MGIVFLTALTYSELGSRFPRSGGVSIYIQEAFGSQWLSILAGLLLFSATILSHAFVGYLAAFGFKLPNWLGVSGFLIILLLINLRSVSPVFEKPAGTSKSPAGTKTGDKYASGGPGRPGPP